jgi:hypothetical protein
LGRRYRPDRIDFDVVVADPASGSTSWATAAVSVVDASTSERELDSDALRSYAAGLAPVLRDFAERVTGPQDGAPVHRFLTYQRVRAVIRDGAGGFVADVRCDGSVTVPGELDPSRRKQFIGMMNGWLPMVIRELDRGSYETALTSLARARTLLDGMLRDVVGLAAGGPEAIEWSAVADAVGTTVSQLDSWYTRPDTLAS